MLQILLVIALFYLANASLKRFRAFLSHTLGFEHELENFKTRLKCTHCPEMLKRLYGELLEFHNQKAEFEYQKRNVRALIGITNARIEMSR
jgi:hypothetical protein